MAANARSKRYTTVGDTDWVTIAPGSGVRRIFMLQVGANSSAVYVHIGGAEPDLLDSFLLSALDVMDMANAMVIGPVRIKAATGGIASVIVLEH